MSKQGFDKEKATWPLLPQRAVTMPEIGELSRPPQTRPPVWVWVLVFVIAVVVLLVIMIRSGARQIGMGGMMIMPIMLLSMLMMMRNRLGGGQNEKTRPAALAQTRVDYMRKLDELREDVHDGAYEQAAEIAYHHPDPTDGSLLTLVATARMWERQPNDRNFGHARMGVGMTGLHTTIHPPNNVPPPEFRETSTAIAARDFLLTQNVVHGVARPLHLFDQRGWAFFTEHGGQRPVVQGLLRALVCQLCVFHRPEVVRVAIITDDMPSWEWAKWLPHVADPHLVDANGPLRMIYSDVSKFMDYHGDELYQRSVWQPAMEGVPRPEDYLVIVLDSPGANAAPLLGAMQAGEAGRTVHAPGFTGVSVLEATGDNFSALATSTTAFIVDEVGNLLRAEQEVA